MSDQTTDDETDTGTSDATSRDPLEVLKIEMRAYHSEMAALKRELSATQGRLQKLTKEQIATRKRLPREDGADDDHAPQAQAPDPYTIAARFAKLTPAQIEYVQSVRTESGDAAAAAALSAMEWRQAQEKSSAPETGGESREAAKRIPPGTAHASAPRASSVVQPRSLSEYQKLAINDRARFDALNADENFDPSALPITHIQR